MDIQQFSARFQKLTDNIEQVIVGKRDVVEGCLIGLLSGGHILLEDVPGVGKTTLAAARSRDYVTPDDVKAVAVAVMGHRLIPLPEARLSGFATGHLVEELLRSVPVEDK